MRPDAASRASEDRTTPEPVLSIDHLWKRYGNVVALRDVSFGVRHGEIFGFVGSNGAGKTTTMRVVMGVVAADSGEVRWAGQPISLATRRHFGYMPEERGLYLKMRVREQLIYLAELHGLSTAAAEREIATWLDRLGLAARGNDDVQGLSHGNQQRVQLAAALVFAPWLLVLDEPFAGLDPIAVDVLSGVLRQQATAGVPVLFSSHQLDLVERLCDRVGIIQRGQMVACGTVDELRHSASPGERLWVEAPAASPGWADNLRGVSVVRREGACWLLALAPDIDDQEVLQAALRTGPVLEFRRDVPSLSEVFRDVVTETERGEG